MFIAYKMQRNLKRICRVIQFFSTVVLIIFTLFMSLTNVWMQWNGNVLTPLQRRAKNSSNSSNVKREGLVPCPIGSFGFPGWKDCIPWLNCSDISLQVHLKKRIGGVSAATKLIWLADWKGYQVVFFECREGGVKRESCAKGMAILEQLQGEFVTRLIGKCTDKLQMVTMFYKHGSARYLDELLRNSQLSKYNNIETRLQLSVDYARIMDYFHNSPTGVRVQCDGASLHKLLSQYLITDDFRLIMNDVDSLKEITENGGCTRRPAVSPTSQQRVERQGRPSESKPFEYRSTWQIYDEKMETWNIPLIVERLLDGVKGNAFAKDQLREIMEKCQAINPQQRPNAGEVLQELLRVQQLIVTNSSYIY